MGLKNKKDNITIYQMEKSSIEYKKTHTIQVSGLADDEMPKWFKSFYENDYKPFQQAMLNFVSKQEEFNKAILARLDNLVVKNNLKE